MLDSKISLATTILTFVLFTGGTGLDRADLAYGQFFENSETNGNTTFSNSTPQNENGSVPMEVGKVPLGSVPMEDYDPDGKVPLGSVPTEELEHLVKVEKIVNYCYENASNSLNPVKDLVDKGLAEQQFTNQTCGSLKQFYDESNEKIK